MFCQYDCALTVRYWNDWHIIKYVCLTCNDIISCEHYCAQTEGLDMNKDNAFYACLFVAAVFLNLGAYSEGLGIGLTITGFSFMGMAVVFATSRKETDE